MSLNVDGISFNNNKRKVAIKLRLCLRDRQCDKRVKITRCILCTLKNMCFWVSIKGIVRKEQKLLNDNIMVKYGKISKTLQIGYFGLW